MHAPDPPQPGNLPKIAADILARLRSGAPRVHCITNTVAQNVTANALLAVGALPSMTTSSEEIASFVASAQALLVNLGTFDRERREAIEIAVKTAAQHGVSWVLDPVLVDRAPPRADFAHELTARGPKVARLNHAEFSVLSGAKSAADTLARYAKEKNIVVGLSGATDLIADGSRLSTISNGHPWMAKVTGMGCVASALTAACLAIESDAWRATVAALLLLGVAGEVAAEVAKGPGSLAVTVIDALARLDGETVLRRARVT